MRRAEVVEVIGRHIAQIARFDVRSLEIFGSVARDEAGPHSDVDFLVRFGGRTTFDQYMGLKLLLEDVLDRRVDLVTEKALRPELRPGIEREAVRVA